MLQYKEYLNTLNEYAGAKDSPIIIYWSSDLNKIENSDWIEFSTNKISYLNNIYQKIQFKVNEKYYSAIYETNTFYFEDNLTEKFESKLRSEFNKNKTTELKNVPKCIEDINKSLKYNL
ncbi:hypothetical protein M0Q97_01045 [Candidatus Dojkabacteria bacterium]|jgi:hypothetical protein|nr:hypothetical protein [Candidatus Dojkabacteria bacterium]